MVIETDSGSPNAGSIRHLRDSPMSGDFCSMFLFIAIQPSPPDAFSDEFPDHPNDGSVNGVIWVPHSLGDAIRAQDFIHKIESKSGIAIEP